MGQLVVIDFGHQNPMVSKKQLATHPLVQRSTRWIEKQVRAGMPSQKDGHKRMFPLNDCLDWISEQEQGGGHAKAG